MEASYKTPECALSWGLQQRTSDRRTLEREPLLWIKPGIYIYILVVLGELPVVCMSALELRNERPR